MSNTRSLRAGPYFRRMVIRVLLDAFALIVSRQRHLVDLEQLDGLTIQAAGTSGSKPRRGRYGTNVRQPVGITPIGESYGRRWNQADTVSPATALLAALSVSASAVDASTFSTNGALLVANVPEDHGAGTY